MTCVGGYACRHGEYSGPRQVATNLAPNLERPKSSAARSRNLYTFDAASTDESSVLENFHHNSSLIEQDQQAFTQQVASVTQTQGKEAQGPNNSPSERLTKLLLTWTTLDLDAIYAL